MFEKFRNKLPIDDSKWNEYTGYFRRLKVPAKTILLNEGETATKIFLIEKGCIRAWFNSNGKDITMQFFFENRTVSGIESLVKNTASQITIETIEPCVLWYINKKDAKRIIKETAESPALRNLFINLLFGRLFDYIKQLSSYIKDTPEQRYLNLIKEQPELIQRVPQHYIASYLGISKVHLSRIKSRLAKQR